MTDCSWWMVDEDAAEHRLPEDLRASDAFGGRDCGRVEQMRPFVRMFSRPGDTVFDPFCGFGTTLLAAALEGRRGLGMEVEAERATLARERLARHGMSDPVVVGALPQSTIPRPIALCLTNIPYFGCRWPGASDAGQLYAASDFGRYLEGLRDVFHAVRDALPEGGYCIAMAENVTLNGRMLPIAWELARVLGSLFVACEERILCYPPRPSIADAVSSGPERTDRSHEYALVYRKARPRIDIERGRGELQAMRDAGFAFRVHGGFAAWEHAAPGAGERPPSDIDLHVPADETRLQALLHWLIARGYRLQLWDEPVDASVPLQRVIEKHYVRAERIEMDGGLMRIDVGVAATHRDPLVQAPDHR